MTKLSAKKKVINGHQSFRQPQVLIRQTYLPKESFVPDTDTNKASEKKETSEATRKFMHFIDNFDQCQKSKNSKKKEMRTSVLFAQKLSTWLKR
jgi:hypothetical protein